MNRATKYIIQLLPLLFGFAVFIFFGFFYRYHLHYQEQLQMFLFNDDYWKNLVAKPGGFADYLGTFFTQFYYFSWLGALIITGMLVLLQQLVYSLANKLQRNLFFMPLTFIPSFLFWGLLCDENFLLGGLIAALLTLLAVQLFASFKNSWVRIYLGMAMLPILYWLTGGIFCVFAMLCLVLEWGYFKQFSKAQWGISMMACVLFITLPFLITTHYLQYPLTRLWLGICYNRFPVVFPYLLLVIWVSLLVIPFIFKFLPYKTTLPETSVPEGKKLHNASAKKSMKGLLVVAGHLLFLFILLKVVLQFSTDWRKEEIMGYDYLVREQQWNKIISMANRKDPADPLSVACLNLALSKDGHMGDCLFRYFQNGPEGLIPTFQRDFTIPFVAGEIYYHLGFLNTSMRFAFEAMEAIPDYKKSSRAMKRIAEVNLLNGEYKVAAKYLHLLQQTLFYKNWASETLKCIDNDKIIDQHPEWAALKKYRITQDFLFSEQEKDQMLGLLFTQCSSNKMAFEYLMAYTLLTKDLVHFFQYFPLGKNLGYTAIPAHYQEALIFIWASKSANLNEVPWSISPAVKQAFARYSELYSSQSSEKQIYENFSQTYWYYFHYRK
jgi:hypothetical protein